MLRQFIRYNADLVFSSLLALYPGAPSAGHMSCVHVFYQVLFRALGCSQKKKKLVQEFTGLNDAQLHQICVFQYI